MACDACSSSDAAGVSEFAPHARHPSSKKEAPDMNIILDRIEVEMFRNTCRRFSI
jgi:hypothetical protein